jgi:myosin-crossreactive antigen
LRRYFLRFMHLMPDQRTMSKIIRTRYTKLRLHRAPAHEVADGPRCAICSEHARLRSRHRRPHRQGDHGPQHHDDPGRQGKTVEVRPQDIVVATLGSMISNSTTGSYDSPPPPTPSTLGGSWALWHTLAKKRKDVFRDPSAFTDHFDESSFTSFTGSSH